MKKTLAHDFIFYYHVDEEAKMGHEISGGGSRILGHPNLGLAEVQHFWGQGMSGGVCPSIVKVNSHDLVHSFCVRLLHKDRGPVFVKNTGGMHHLHPL